MVEVHEISEEVYILSTHLKENQISVASFLILDEKPTLIETGTMQAAKNFTPEIEKIIPLEKISYIFVTHEHLDHMGGLPEYISEAYNAETVAHRYTKAQLGFMGIVGKTILTGGGETIPLGKRKIEVIHAPIETAGTTIFNLQPDGILFTGDYFGQLTEEKWTLHSQSTEQLLQKITELHQGLGYTHQDIKAYLSPLRKIPLKIIAPSHGSIIQKDLKQVIENTLKTNLKPAKKGTLWSKIFGV
ncbi:MAG: MBL fold metallo-hydrolase [Candidatus Freyarchaeota archaeon]|nr:MBL fold metallo-hydrolase [Candidatus Jordarchaeia archaeon]MBS7267620.1 MBL fold metallo-hydrolase [Candidatus Jordarchaeia archaeon]MBS7278827.1 MBL fold metallo-hydrolase [Candidatus Jordarchaeia archaeon]